jgi:hypothetical protein
MTLYALAFCNAFVFIALKAFQQLNVTKGHFFWVIPTSMAMAMCEVWLVVQMASYGWGWSIVLSIGAGSGLGAVSAMYLHGRYVHGR